jgi:hypothetical protein
MLAPVGDERLCGEQKYLQSYSMGVLPAYEKIGGRWMGVWDSERVQNLRINEMEYLAACV